MTTADSAPTHLCGAGIAKLGQSPAHLQSAWCHPLRGHRESPTGVRDTLRAAHLPHCNKGVPARRLSNLFLKPSSIASPISLILTLTLPSDRFLFSPSMPIPHCSLSLLLHVLSKHRDRTPCILSPCSCRGLAGPAIIL